MISVSTRCANPNHQVTSIALNRVSGFLGVEIDKDASLAIITPLPWPTSTDGLLALVGVPNGGVHSIGTVLVTIPLVHCTLG